ncbi:head GIN domain-containing protein [Sphingopyxis sp. MWB1]|uniref:head GIN domain-containing protein n=1 Tax=Sphingopyxis sp. MWB1 TaxID=1537715 RepID=UPI00051A1528|nr:head GIN domain-containing protein [Sphingopyxis sp. MWB1]
MRNWTMAALPLAMALTVAGCDGSLTLGNDDSKSESVADSGTSDAKGTRSYAFEGFESVTVTGPDDVTIRRGERFAVEASGPESELARLEIEADGKELKIGRKRQGFQVGRIVHKAVKISITMPRLSAVRLTGSGDIEADALEEDAVSATLTGSGNLKIGNLAGRRGEISIAGSGNVEVDGGTIDKGEYNIAGSGNIDAEKLVAKNLDITLAGSGDIEAGATGEADVRVMGSGDVTLTGGAKCSTRTMGSGDVTCR